jgi:hypothetical protein
MNPFTEKSRCTLKNKNPLNAAQNNVVRQRSTVHREEREREPPQTEIVVKNHEMTRSENRD